MVLAKEILCQVFIHVVCGWICLHNINQAWFYAGLQEVILWLKNSISPKLLKMFHTGELLKNLCLNVWDYLSLGCFLYYLPLRLWKRKRWRKACRLFTGFGIRFTSLSLRTKGNAFSSSQKSIKPGNRDGGLSVKPREDQVLTGKLDLIPSCHLSPWSGVY